MFMLWFEVTSSTKLASRFSRLRGKTTFDDFATLHSFRWCLRLFLCGCVSHHLRTSTSARDVNSSNYSELNMRMHIKLLGTKQECIAPYCRSVLSLDVSASYHLRYYCYHCDMSCGTLERFVQIESTQSHHTLHFHVTTQQHTHSHTHTLPLTSHLHRRY